MMKCKNCVRYVHLNDDGERTAGTPNWCFYLSDSPNEELERDCMVFKPLTNADRIRAMTDEELAQTLCAMTDERCPPWRDEDPSICHNHGVCHDGECWLKWLKQEATE